MCMHGKKICYWVYSHIYFARTAFRSLNVIYKVDVVHFSGSWRMWLYKMAGNVGSETDIHHTTAYSLLHDSQNVPSSVVTAVSSAAIGTSECPALDGPCSMLPVTADGEPLPPSCVVEDDDEPVIGTSPRQHRHYRRHRSGSRRHHRFCRVKWKEVSVIISYQVGPLQRLAQPEGSCRLQQPWKWPICV